MAGEADGEVVVPPTLQALLAARLDQLEPAERWVLERAAVEGEVFHRGAVQALAPSESQVTPRLAALVRKELIRPDRPQLAGEDGFRFRHLLIRDAAYDALPKATRAELHERFADWLEQHGAELVERDEILGYHLEQAYRYRTELGTPDDERSGRRGPATPHGRRSPRATVRQDYAAAATPARARRRARTSGRARPRPRDRPDRRAVLGEWQERMTRQSGEKGAGGFLGESPREPMRRLDGLGTEARKSDRISRKMKHRLQELASELPPVLDQWLQEGLVPGTVTSDGFDRFGERPAQRNGVVTAQRMCQGNLRMDPFESVFVQRQAAKER